MNIINLTIKHIAVAFTNNYKVPPASYTYIFKGSIFEMINPFRLFTFKNKTFFLYTFLITAALQTTAYTESSEDRSVYKTIYSLISSGDFRSADSLMKVFDSEGKIGITELLLWTRVKFIIKDYSRSGPLYCRVLNLCAAQKSNSSSSQRTINLALDQFATELADAGKDNAAAILEEFRKCAFQIPQRDSMTLRKWFADRYAFFEMFDKELEILTSLRPSGITSNISTDLTDLARERFIREQYLGALQAAKEARKYSENKKTESDAAALIYQSFLALRMADSASAWIKYADLSSEKQIAAAIVLYQQSAQLQQAEILLDKINSSVTKDTLLIRQELYSGNPQNAALMLKKLRFLKNEPYDFLLWNIRLNLYAKKTGDALPLLDSIPAPAKFCQAAELIMYKYQIEVLQDCPEALEAYALIEYNIYLGNLKDCIQILGKSSAAADCLQFLSLRISRAMNEKNMITDALRILNGFDELQVSAEFLYFKALYLYKTGQIDTSKSLLERLMFDFSNDIYSGKARLLLSELNAKR